MKIEVKPQETTRAEAFSLWMTSPMPMVTLTKTFNVSKLIKASKRKGLKFNALLCWCIGKAASNIKEFYILPEKDKLFKYDSIAINVIVNNCKGGINSCDISFNNDIQQFVRDYDNLTIQAINECKSSFIDDCMIIGTSAMIQTQLDSIVNQYTDKFCNPMVMWGKYRRNWVKTILPISFQFHHVQMDGGHGAYFLEQLQQEINKL
ncbi:MAG: chloramphenicol acetyltransferase [Prevotella sp.]|nr:chloramphenicol acetyltransferase [Prevotella sp.]